MELYDRPIRNKKQFLKTFRLLRELRGFFDIHFLEIMLIGKKYLLPLSHILEIPIHGQSRSLLIHFWKGVKLMHLLMFRYGTSHEMNFVLL